MSENPLLELMGKHRNNVVTYGEPFRTSISIDELQERFRELTRNQEAITLSGINFLKNLSLDSHYGYMGNLLPTDRPLVSEVFEGFIGDRKVKIAEFGCGAYGRLYNLLMPEKYKRDYLQFDINRKFVDHNLGLMNRQNNYGFIHNIIKRDNHQPKIALGDAYNMPLKDESVDGIITSPPYSIALNYVANDAHSLKALGYDLDKIKEDFIGVRGTGLNRFELYDKDMEKAYGEMYRVLKKDKYCVVIIGNVTFQGQEINTTQNVIDYCEKIGFKTIKKMEKIIYGLYNVMQKEYILIFQKIT